MSGLTPIPLTRFRDLLGTRGLSVADLADVVGCGRSHLSQVLWGHRDGGETWPLIRAVVTAEEWAQLCQMEHCATWNTAQQAKGPTALVWRMRAVCAKCQEHLRFEPCIEQQAGLISHGLCPPCFEVAMGEIDALRVATKPRAYLVNTEAGLDVRTSPTRPALAHDGELPSAFRGLPATEIVFTCRPGTRRSA